MKFLVLIFIFIFAGTAESPNVNRLRDLYEYALFKKDKAEELISYVDETKSTPLTEGYKDPQKCFLPNIHTIRSINTNISMKENYYLKKQL